MRRAAAVLPALVVLVGLYLIATQGGVHHRNRRGSAPARPATAQVITPAPRIPVARTAPLRQPAAHPGARPHAQARRRGVITASRTDCRWRRYQDGALGSDRDCAPGAVNPAVVGHTAQTVCNPRWVASASNARLPPATQQRLVIEYQLPGPLSIYVVARVVPIEDGGSATNPRNLYVLPLNGWGGERTQAVVAQELRSEICAHKLTVAQAAQTLEVNWLAKGVQTD